MSGQLIQSSTIQSIPIPSSRDFSVVSISSAALYLPLPIFAAGVLGGRCRVFARPLPRLLFALAAMAAMVLTAVLRSRLALVIVDWGNL